MSVSGLAEGFLAGFNTMDRYQRGQKEDERQERELGLRDTMVKQGIEDSNRNFSLRQAEFDNAVEQQKTAKEQWGQEFDLKKKEVDSLRSYRDANLGFAQAAEGRAKQEHEWQVKDREKQAYQQEHMPIIQSGWQAIAELKEPSQQFWSVVRDQRAGTFNPERYLQPDYAEAGKTFVTHAGNLMRQAQEGKLDPTTPEGHAAVNNPQFIKAAGTLYQDEVNKGVGDIDPDSGKTITGKQLSNIMITPDGRGVVLGVEVTYDDGSKAVRPVTNNRTSAPDDTPKVIPINDFLKPAYQRAALAKHMIGNADQLRTSLGLTAGPDQAGYKKAVTELEKQHGQNRARIASSNADGKDLQLEALDDQLEQSKAALADTYGLTTKTDEPKQEAPLKAWTGGDPERLLFIKEMSHRGKLSEIMDDPAKMNTSFRLWSADEAKKKAEEQAAVTANRLRDARQSMSPTQTAGRLRDAEAGAYQAISLAQARK
ncbi:hypothetical protein [Aeromonas veronii]|uniref:hypothetical protein n=1 Tax=Aeromonas veronii TaxID=654 RepID=UPI001F4351E2|nr:hypothetical protein [Aeromonas veronii]